MNITREEIERRLERVLIGPSNTVQMSLPDYQEIHRFALRALDMWDGIERLVRGQCRVLSGEAAFRACIREEIKKFDEGDGAKNP